MKIGQAAATAGVSPDTLRYYERLGLLPSSARQANGYRVYSDAAIRRVLLIRNALAFGFSLRELASFLRARETTRPPCQEVRTAAQRLLNDVEQQIVELTATQARMRRTLREWDKRLGAAAPGAPAHLLAALPAAAPASRRPASRRLRPAARMSRGTKAGHS